jgi:hypothetical protein
MGDVDFEIDSLSQGSGYLVTSCMHLEGGQAEEK